MFCTYCGTRLADDAVVCMNCGGRTKNLRAQRPADRVGTPTGVVVLAYVLALLIPVIGALPTLGLIGDRQFGHAGVCIAINLIACLCWLQALLPLMV